MEKGCFRQVKIKILPLGDELGMGGWWLGAADPGAHTCLGVLTGFGKGRSRAGLPYISGLALFLCVSTYVQDFQPKEILTFLNLVWSKQRLLETQSKWFSRKSTHQL